MKACLVLLSALATAPQTAPEAMDRVRVEGTAIIDGIANVAGGLASDASMPYLLRGSVIATGDALDWPGLRLTFAVLATGGAAPGPYVGDLQGVSNITAATALRPYEAWVQQNMGARLSILAGLYDINSEFDAIELAGLFLNSSFGIGPDFSQAGPNGPGTFPATALGVRVAAAPLPHVRARLAVVDGTPGDPSDPARIDVAWRSGDGALVAGEAAYLVGLADAGPPQGGRRFLGRGSGAPGDGTVGVGVWRFAGVPAPSGGPNPQGAYLLAERLLVSGDHRALGVFGRFGVAEGGPVGTYAGLGVHSAGWLVRSGDAAGIGLAVAWPDADHRRRSGLPAAKAETVLELTYRANLSPWMFVQPDVQYVINPVYGQGANRALVLVVRAAVLH